MPENKPTNITWHDGVVTRDDRRAILRQRGVTIWLTGLSASGKSTIAVLLEKMLIQQGKLAYRLDGDNIRHGLCSNLGFSAEDRSENIRRIGEVAKLFTDAGTITICSFISPYRKDRQWLRSNMAIGDFIEVYIHVPLEIAEQRDPKGLYKKARDAILNGRGLGFTGIDDPYEAPENPELLIETQRQSPEESAMQILTYLETGGYLS